VTGTEITKARLLADLFDQPLRAHG
jgi:hypothetical protein